MTLTKTLFLDFESRSLVDLTVVGNYRYATHPSTEVLMLAYAFNNGPVEIWEPHKGPMPKKLLSALLDPEYTKLAWYVPFERSLFLHKLGIDIPLDSWIDIMIWARHLSLPGSLESCGAVMGLGFEQAKIKDGARLIDLFCSPYNLGGKVTLFGISPPEFHDWDTNPEDWKLFLEYCKRDVEVERTLFQMLQATPLPQSEQELWVLDQIINERGVPTNRNFVTNCYAFAQRCKDEDVKKLKEMTKLENPNSRPQILPWLKEHGYPYESLNKSFVNVALAKTSLPKECRDALLLRQNTSKTSYTKLETLLEMLADDDRLRNQFSFLGASRSGRWSGSGVQLHNLPRSIKWVEKHLQEAIDLVAANNYEGLQALLALEKNPPSIIAVATSLIRSCFQAPEGKKLVVSDLNAIENRVLGWVTGEDAILQVFREGRCPYVSFAAEKMYHTDYKTMKAAYDRYEKGIGNADDAVAAERRQIAKPVVLGAGYGLGAGVDRYCKKCDHLFEFRDDFCKECGSDEVRYTAVVDTDDYGNEVKTGLMGYAANMGVDLSPEDAYKAWRAFREYKKVVQGWYDMENAAVEVLKNGGKVKVGPVIFDRKKRKNGQFILRILLPSGRYLHYMNARIETEMKTSKAGEQYEKHKIMYDGIGHGVGMISKGWGQVYTYGGKLMENVVQAISRDILAYGMMAAHKIGAEIVLHVHDEIAALTDAFDPFAFSLADLSYCMGLTPPWAPGLPLLAKGFEGRVYRK